MCERASNLLVILLLLSLEGGHGDTVQITLARLGDAAATLLLVELKNTNLLEGLADLAVNGTGGVDVTAGAGTAVLGGAVDLAQTADTDVLAHVDVTGDGSSADVEPVNVLGRKLLGGTGLDSVDPTLCFAYRLVTLSWASLAGDSRLTQSTTSCRYLRKTTARNSSAGLGFQRLRHDMMQDFRCGS